MKIQNPRDIHEGFGFKGGENEKRYDLVLTH